MSLLAGEGGGGESGVEFSGLESELIPNIFCVDNLAPCRWYQSLFQNRIRAPI